jgi:hypothetical protein
VDKLDAPQIRELFIDELTEVQGGGPVDELIRKLKDQDSTMACCEEGPDGCCDSPW